MPRNKFQNVIFTIIMAVIMVYGMIVYNVALNTGGVTNQKPAPFDLLSFLTSPTSVPLFSTTCDIQPPHILYLHINIQLFTSLYKPRFFTL